MRTDRNRSGATARVRPAKPRDARALRQVMQAAFAPYVQRLGYRPNPMDRDFGVYLKKNFVLALEDHGAACGFAVTRPDSRGGLYVEALAVRPEAQGAGGGRLLMEGVEALASSLSLDRVRLHTVPALPHLLGFYRHVGYRLIERAGGGTWERVMFEKPVRTALEIVLEC